MTSKPNISYADAIIDERVGVDALVVGEGVVGAGVQVDQPDHDVEGFYETNYLVWKSQDPNLWREKEGKDHWISRVCVDSVKRPVKCVESDNPVDPVGNFKLLWKQKQRL